MRGGWLRLSGQDKKVTWIAWSLTSVLFLFTVENIWIDPWLRNKSHWVPSLVPGALSGAWFLTFAIGGIALTLIIVCQVFLIRDHRIPVWKKIGTGIATLVILLLSVQWFYVTNGRPGLLQLHALGKTHKVILTWGASKSQVAGYNVYRSTTPGGNYLRINSSLVQGLTYTDNTVESGVTYHYVTRAADALGNESANSPEFSITIP
jgi:hypothetical protein